MRIQITAIKAPASALQAKQSRRAARWRAIAYSTAILPLLLMVALAWLRPGSNRTEIPDWRPVLALADALREKGDLYEARHLYLQVDRIASWQQDWEGLTAAACGIKSLRRCKNQPISVQWVVGNPTRATDLLASEAKWALA